MKDQMTVSRMTAIGITQDWTPADIVTGFIRNHSFDEDLIRSFIEESIDVNNDVDLVLDSVHFPSSIKECLKTYRDLRSSTLDLMASYIHSGLNHAAASFKETNARGKAWTMEKQKEEMEKWSAGLS